MSLREAIEAIAACHDDGDVWDRYAWAYVDGDGPLATRQWYLSTAEDEEDHLVDEFGEGLPAFAAERSMHHYLEAATFADVLGVQKRQRPASELADYARALEHYHRYDAFLDLGGFATGDGDAPLHPELSRGLHTEYDLSLAQCPAERAAEAARAVSAVLELPLGEALALCRQPPVDLGRRIDALACARIERRFAALSLPLLRRTYRALAWLPPQG
jgi:hypothetical protein